jgi:hypothetical protein
MAASVTRKLCSNHNEPLAGFEDEDDEDENETPFEAKGPGHLPGF